LRPGLAPEHDVTISTAATSSSSHSVEVVVTDELEREFCGALDAVHTTFRGQVSVAFSARSASAPPVSGSLEGLVLDIAPAHATPPSVDARSEEARRFAGFLGVTLRGLTDAGPFVVDTLDPHGRALNAGLEVGDSLIELDGVTLRAEADFLPPPRVKLSRLTLR